MPAAGGSSPRCRARPSPTTPTSRLDDAAIPALGDLPLDELTASVGLEIAGLRRSFGANAVLTGIDLAIGGGEVVALVGASSCGKDDAAERRRRLHPRRRRRHGVDRRRSRHQHPVHKSPPPA